MLRNTRETEIYSVSVLNGKRSLLFSDEGMNLEVRARGAVSRAGKAYMEGVWREWHTTPVPGVDAEEAFYEISLDGSNHFRRVADHQSSQAPPLLNSQSTKVVFETFVKDKFVVSIYSVPEWKLLHSWDLTKLAQVYCPACAPISYGWLADGNRLFFGLGLVGEDDEDESATENKPGTYVASDDGVDLGSISPVIGSFQIAGYVHPKFIEPRFFGQLPDGRYLFQDYGAKQGKPLTNIQPFLVISSSDSKLQKEFPLKFPIGTCYLSPSGKYIAYLEERQTPNYRPEFHLRVKDLESGAEKELAAAPPSNPPTSPEPNVTLSVLGWVGDK